ncbi:YqaJ-like viral recombinase domain [Mycoplasmopsis maculosa]|uniref:YqaJ-like viral recombinase domain n=1 Tax=Mycoplasmopsis maculosa TaxID=114885 RepID=A0A449B4J5_9BACT|nr:YqaJ viral recombinase family protein [Mycoplasmopsis maculosa]VEU75510.1 YqaJ-like viral recombinase domain [Mycoplasmopsis maculosa]
MSSKPKTRFYNGKEYILDEKERIIILTDEFHDKLLNSKNKFTSFKKFGGSSISDIFETDSFKSQFGAFCHLARLKMPVLQEKYIKAGIAVEPKIFEILKEKYPKLDIEHIRAEDYGYDYFEGKHNILGGVPDGLIPSQNIVLEMKTVNIKKFESWSQENNAGVPLDYRKQAQLYAYLLGFDKYSIVAAFLEDSDYIKPEEIDLNKRNVKTYNFKVNKEMAKDDVKRIIDFYEKYTALGKSPKYQLPRDIDQVEYLKCHNVIEWKQLFDKWKKEGKIDEDIEFNWI